MEDFVDILSKEGCTGVLFSFLSVMVPGRNHHLFYIFAYLAKSKFNDWAPLDPTRLRMRHQGGCIQGHGGQCCCHTPGWDTCWLEGITFWIGAQPRYQMLWEAGDTWPSGRKGSTSIETKMGKSMLYIGYSWISDQEFKIMWGWDHDILTHFSPSDYAEEFSSSHHVQHLSC